MKRVALLALLATGAVAAQAQPQGPSFVDRARVQEVQPQYESVQVPRQECRSQWVQDAPVASGGGYGGAIIGGVAGGLLGNQVGKGHGKEAATAAGAVIGAITGDRIQNNNNYPQQVVQAPPREVRQCRTVMDSQQQLTGYRVTYEYRGNEYVTVMREQPGRSLPVRVSVTPLDEREYHRN